MNTSYSDALGQIRFLYHANIWFITHMYSVHYASSIIGSRVSTISFTHKLVGSAEPKDNFYIKILLMGVRRRSVSVDSRRPIDRHVSLKL